MLDSVDYNSTAANITSINSSSSSIESSNLIGRSNVVPPLDHPAALPTTPTGGFFSALFHELIAMLFGTPTSAHSNLTAMKEMWGNNHNGLLHFGTREYVLFSFWKVGTAAGMICSVLLVFLIAVLHEAVIGLRFFLDREAVLFTPTTDNVSSSTAAAAESNQRSREQLVYVNETRRSDPSHGARGTTSRCSCWRGFARQVRAKITGRRVIQASLYAVQWTLFFTLLLIVVTFNVWLIMAAIWGKAVGYFIFIGSTALERVERMSMMAMHGGAVRSNEGGGRGVAEVVTLSEVRRNMKSY